MTAQMAEKLYYEGRKVSMCSNPLSNYFALSGIKPGFQDLCTALWRGYIGTWEIVDGRLYLTGVRGTLDDGSEASVSTFFPDFPDRVFAHWYSGTLRIPQGKLLEYVHGGYGSTYEEDVMLTVEKGVIVSTEVRRNGVSDDPEASEGYGVGAFTIFPKKSPTHDGD